MRLLCAVAFLFSSPLSSGLQLTGRIPTPVRRRLTTTCAPSSTAVYMSDRGESSGLSIKVLGVGLIAAVGVFGSDLFSTLGTVAQGAKQATIASTNAAPTLKQGKGSETRGALTRLTRREINEKLSQVPVFFVKNAAGGIDVRDGVGAIFSAKADAEAYAKGSTVGAATLDEVFYTLIEKKTKLSLVTGVAGKCDADATYVLRPSPAEMQETGTDFQQTHPNDFPLFRVSNLAFQKDNGLEIPLFLSKADALGAFERLQASKGAADGGKGPDVQVTSVLNLIDLFSAGGIEGRAIEMYPRIEEITNFKSLSSSL